MNLSKLLNSFNKNPSIQTGQPPQNYNLSQNYYPQEAYQATPTSQTTSTQKVQTSSNVIGGLDIQSLLPLLSGMNGGGGLNIANLIKGNEHKSSNPLSSLTSILGAKKQDTQDVDLNKNSQLKVENFQKISDLD